MSDGAKHSNRVDEVHMVYTEGLIDVEFLDCRNKKRNGGDKLLISQAECQIVTDFCGIEGILPVQNPVDLFSQPWTDQAIDAVDCAFSWMPR